MIRKVRHVAEAALFLLAWGVFRLLPLDAASWLGGRTAGLIGPRLPAHRVALTNLSLAFPDKPLAERKAIARAMWEHLGRVAGEFVHLPGNGLYSRISFTGLENAPIDRSVIFVSGHFGNWELCYPMAHEHGIPIVLVYRHSNNPYIERMITHLRRSHATDLVQKGHRGAVKMAKVFRRNQSLAMLVDQKMNEGVALPFFGHDAMTAPAYAQFALRYGVPVVPAKVVRTEGAHFKATIYPPITVKEGDDEKTILLAVNRLLESWIRENPHQWLWIHRRWPREMYAS